MSDQTNQVYAVAHARGGGIIPKNIPGLAWNILMAAWVAFGAQTFLKMCVFAIQPVYAEEFGLGAFACLLFPMVFTFLQAPLSPILTHRTDRLGGGFSRRHMTIIVGMICALVASLIAFKPLSSTFVTFMILVAVCALFLGPGEPLVCAMASDWFPMEHRGFALGFHHTGYPWGSFVAGLSISWLLSHFGNENWRICFLLLSLPMVLVCWWIGETVTLKNQRKLVHEISKAGFHSSISDEKLPSEVGTEQKKVTMGEAWNLTMKNPTQLIMVINGFLICGSYWVWAGFLPLFIYYVGKYSAAETAAYTVMFAITGGMGQIIWGGLSDKIGRKLSFMCIFIWAIVGFYFMQYSLISLTWLIGAQIFVGFSTNAPYPIFYAVAYDVADRRVKGLAMGFIDLGFYLGALLLLLTGGLIELGGGKASATGYYWVLYMLMTIYAIATLLTLLCTRETKGWFFKHDWAIVSRASSNVPEL